MNPINYSFPNTTQKSLLNSALIGKSADDVAPTDRTIHQSVTTTNTHTRVSARQNNHLHHPLQTHHTISPLLAGCVVGGVIASDMVASGCGVIDGGCGEIVGG